MRSLDVYNAASDLRGDHAAARVHRGSWGSDGMVDRRKSATSVARGRLSERRLCDRLLELCRRISGWPQGKRVRRGSEHSDRISLGEGHYDRLPEMAADLVRRQVSVIAANTPANLIAKAATNTIPIVFTAAGDPVQLGLVASLSRPGGNVTGVSQMNVEIGPKRLELAYQLMPNANVVGFLLNPSDPARARELLKDAEAAAARLGLRLDVFRAATDVEIETVISE